MKVSTKIAQYSKEFLEVNSWDFPAYKDYINKCFVFEPNDLSLFSEVLLADGVSLQSERWHSVRRCFAHGKDGFTCLDPRHVLDSFVETFVYRGDGLVPTKKFKRKMLHKASWYENFVKAQAVVYTCIQAKSLELKAHANLRFADGAIDDYAESD